jgi:5'-nucleotidase
LSDTILNVNVPDVPLTDIQGFQTTRLGKRHQSEKSIPDKDDASKFWIGL